MLFILLSILCSVCVLLVFKICDRKSISSRKTIVVSYFVSAVASVIAFSSLANGFYSNWFLPAALEGLAFYGVFRLISKSAETSGLSVTSVASKMSVLIPIFVGIFILNEPSNGLIVLGIIVGLAAVYLSAGSGVNTGSWVWPLLVFVGSGLIDSSFKLFQVWGLTEAEFPLFITTVFSFAFLFSFFHLLASKNRNISLNHILAGSALGLSNLGAVYFILLALATPSLESVFVYSMTNFGVVVLATIVAVVAFQERFDFKARVGLASAAVSILVLHLAYS